MRLLCLVFPGLAIQLALRDRPGARGRPLILIAGHGDEAAVTAATAEACRRGVSPGLSAAAARAACPEALTLADNAGSCLDELDRVAGIIRRRATTRVTVGGRDHIFVDLAGLPGDEALLAARLAGLARAWSGTEVRVGLASTTADALRAGRFARRQPVLLPPDAAADAEPPCFGRAPLAGSATLLPDERQPVARLRSLAARLDAILGAREESFREAILVLEGNQPGEARLCPRQPAHAIAPLLDALLGAVPRGALEGASHVTLRLERPGPAIAVPAASAPGFRAPLAQAS